MGHIHMTKQVTLKLANDLKKASTINEAAIWSKLAEFATKPSSARRTLNINRLNELTKDNDSVVFPGKILGTGNISHKITLSCFSISNSAASKIFDAGGKVVSFANMIEQNPKGKGVVMLG